MNEAEIMRRQILFGKMDEAKGIQWTKKKEYNGRSKKVIQNGRSKRDIQEMRSFVNFSEYHSENLM